MIDLPFIWAAIIGFAVIMYVIMDGFDLGLGILFPFVRKSVEKDVMMNSVAPFWDGNETWLVLGGTGLFAAFPKAYALILPVLYLPLYSFLIGLILRGVAFEFRFKSSKHRYVWDMSFAGGSILATLSQGIMLGRFIEGFPIVGGGYTTTTLPWLTPFSVFTGIGLLSGYALLGSTWLILKTEGALQAWGRAVALKLMFIVFGFIAAASFWTPLAVPQIANRWFTWPNILYFSPVPMYTGLLALGLFWGLRRKSDYLPFMCSIGLFVLAYSGLAISLWPYIVPRVMTIWDAASPPSSQLFALVGVLFLIPIILTYTIHTYWVFRGKTGEGYDHT